MLRAACQRWISSEEHDHQRGQKHQAHNKSRGSQIPREAKTAADSLQEKQSVKKAVNAETRGMFCRKVLGVQKGTKMLPQQHNCWKSW